MVLRHSDGGETELQDEASIYGGTLSHGDGHIMHDDDDDEAEGIFRLPYHLTLNSSESEPCSVQPLKATKQEKTLLTNRLMKTIT